MSPQQPPSSSTIHLLLSGDWWNALLSHPAAAGAIGGLVRAVVRGERNLVRASLSVAVGSVVAAYAGPVAAVVADRYAGLDDVPDLSLASFLGFMLGLAAWTMCEALLQRVGSWLDTPPRLPPSPPE